MLTSLSRIPNTNSLPYRFVFQQTSPSPSNFTSSTTTQVMNLITISPNWVVKACRILPIIQFIGTSITSVTLQIGTTANPSLYASPYELTQVITPTNLQISSALAQSLTTGDGILATFTTVGNSINAITAGMVSIDLDISSL